jgi:hypothetical protein
MTVTPPDPDAVIDELQLTPTLPGVSVSRLRERLIGKNDLSSHTIVATSKEAIRIVDDTMEAVDDVIRATEYVRRALRDPDGFTSQEPGSRTGFGGPRRASHHSEENRILQAGARHGRYLLFAATSGILAISIISVFLIGKLPLPKLTLADADRQGQPVAMTIVTEAPFSPDPMPVIGISDGNGNIKAAEVELSTAPASTQDTSVPDAPKDRILTRAQETIEHPAPQLTQEQIANLIERGSEFFAIGDMKSARLLFERAAEARDAKAAFALAATYDPIALPELGIHVPAADLGRARDWYHKALELGSPGAARRLELLASWRG